MEKWKRILTASGVFTLAVLVTVLAVMAIENSFLLVHQLSLYVWDMCES